MDMANTRTTTAAMPSYGFGEAGAPAESRTPSGVPGGDVQTTLGATALVEARPHDLSAAEVAVTASGGTLAAPELQPPAAALDIRAVTSVWVNNQHVSALWSINQNRNSWAAFVGSGWQKFSNNSDSAIVAFTLLASIGKVAQSNVNYRTEADHMIHEMYVL